MIVKRCSVDDIDEIYEIEKESFTDPMKKETVLKDLARESYYCYGLFEDGLRAFISFEKVFEEGQIISVATAKEHRKKGLAKKLFVEVSAFAQKDGVELFTLEVRSDNGAAKGLYKSLGFNEVGLRKNYYQNPLCDAILMDLHI